MTLLSWSKSFTARITASCRLIGTRGHNPNPPRRNVANVQSSSDSFAPVLKISSKSLFLVHLLRMPHSVHGLNEPMLCEALSAHLSVDAASSCAMLLRSELQSQKTKPSEVLFTSTAAPRPLKAGPLQAGYICKGLFASSPEADGLG